MKQINSVQNTYIKHLVQLQEKARVRKKHGLFVIEGKREITLAIQGNYQLKTILFCPDVFAEETLLAMPNLQTVEKIKVSKEVYKKIAYRSSTEGIIAVAYTKSITLATLKLTKNPLLLVAEGIEKPGNLGALLRTADAANIDAVIIANPKTDIYNPNVIRSSVGCLFTNQIVQASSKDTIAFLQANAISIYAATLQNSTAYYTQNYTTPTALVVGTEATGLTAIWRTENSNNIIIPMQGKIDSMNVSVAASILLFEAKRQRNFL